MAFDSFAEDKKLTSLQVTAEQVVALTGLTMKEAREVIKNGNKTTELPSIDKSAFVSKMTAHYGKMPADYYQKIGDNLEAFFRTPAQSQVDRAHQVAELNKSKDLLKAATATTNVERARYNAEAVFDDLLAHAKSQQEIDQIQKQKKNFEFRYEAGQFTSAKEIERYMATIGYAKEFNSVARQLSEIQQQLSFASSLAADSPGGAFSNGMNDDVRSDMNNVFKAALDSILPKRESTPAQEAVEGGANAERETDTNKDDAKPGQEDSGKTPKGKSK